MIRTTPILAALAVAGTIALPSAAASAHAKSNPNVTILKRGPNGHATEVRIDGRDWAVCTKKITDHCINPRAAGLAWGNRPLGYWLVDHTGKAMRKA